MEDISIFWLRRDLRLNDNAGLYQALLSGKPVLCAFIFDAEILQQLEDKTDRRVLFIYQQLEQLRQQLRAVGSDLLLGYGKPEEVWENWISNYPVKSVYTNHDYEPYAIKRDQRIGAMLREKGIGFHTFKDQVIFERNEIVKEDGSPYTVFTPYSKRWKARLAAGYHGKQPLDATLALQSPFVQSYPSEKHKDRFIKLAEPLPWITLEAMGFQISEGTFPSTLVDEEVLLNYRKNRDFPAVPGTSRQSVHLRFGTISIRKLVRQALPLNETYVNELIWREFYMQILWHFPRVVNQSFRPEYDRITWRNNEEEFRMWCEGKTGYPIVDAGMRELNAKGYMHNRVRMIVASFLTKNLLIDWRWGEAYFAAKLLDFELASNNGGWQWASGSGTDAAPYFRVFNPALQTEKFDPNYTYIRKWIPEYGTPAYPKPIVDQAFSRDRCLEAYKVALKP